MEINRINSILNNDAKFDVYYNEHPVWIQSINNDMAKIGLIDTFEEKDVYIKDLYERDLK